MKNLFLNGSESKVPVIVVGPDQFILLFTVRDIKPLMDCYALDDQEFYIFLN